MKQILSLSVKSIEVEGRKREKLYVLNLVNPIPHVRGSRRFQGKVLEMENVDKVYFCGDLLQISGDVRESGNALRVVVTGLLDVTEPKYEKVPGKGEIPHLVQPSLTFLVFKPFNKQK